VEDLAREWPFLVQRGWAAQVQTAPVWWRDVGRGSTLPTPLWFNDHFLVIDIASYVSPAFAQWWEKQIPAVPAELDEEQKRAEALAAQHAEAQAWARVGNNVLRHRSETLSASPGSYGHTNYNGGWTAPNQYWDPTIPR
jgi:hypothetical protein